MDVTVASAKGLPEKAYLSLRAGEVRKQIQYKPGECFSFDGKQVPRHLVVDIFEKVGSAQVSLSDLSSCSDGNQIQLQGRDGSIVLDMQAKVRSETKKPRVSRHQAALEAQSYLEAHSVQRVLQGMVHELLTTKPADPYSFMMGYIQASSPKRAPESEPPQEEEPELEDLPDWSAMPGRGDAEYPGFASDGAQPLPDLSRHHNVLAAVLLAQPELYEQLKDVRTPSGASLARCVKPGVDHRGHKIVRTLGLVAADEACYETFAPVFDAVMAKWDEAVLQDVQLPELSASSSALADASVVLSVQVICSRNLRGLRMLPSAEREDRREVERILVDALLCAEDELLAGGEYHPLRGSQSFVAQPHGMSQVMEQRLKAAGQLLQEPQSGLSLSSGLGRQWPDARGVFASGDLVAWINEADHLRLAYQRPDADVWQALDATLRVEAALSKYLEAKGHSFSSSDLGYLSFSPGDVGAALQASARLMLPKLATDEAKLKAMCRQLGLYPLRRREFSEDGDRIPVWEVTVARRRGMSAEHIGRLLAQGCARLAQAELGKDQAAREAAVSAEFGKEGVCPAEMPDVGDRHSLAAEVLRQDPSIYQRLKDQRTPLGVSFASCVKTCFENLGHRMIKTVGAVAGDEASYETFRELFDGIIRLRHPGAENHRTDLDTSKMLDIDPAVAGERVVCARLRVTRNLSKLRMPPACCADERRAVEARLAQAFSSLTGTLEGEYFPLIGSHSYTPKPGGMSEEEEQRLHEAGFLFEEPDSSVLVSSGYARDWPDARGVFVDNARSFAVFVNELDHLRINATDKKDCSLKALCARVFSVLDALEGHLEPGLFARSARLGFLGSDPALLGSCLVASVAIRIPLLSMNPEFRAICQRLKPRAQLCASAELGLHQGVWEVQNSVRLGCSEVEQVNAVVGACLELLALEARLERGEDLTAEEPAAEVAVSAALGSGEEEYPGFPVDACPQEMPDLSRHNSQMAEILSADPSIYEELKDLRTPLGVSLARCIKPGVDCAGHSFFRMIGACAGDEHCYEVFQKLFNPIIARRPAGALQLQVEEANLDAVLSVQVSLERNLHSFRFTPAMDLPERRRAEAILSAALETLQQQFAGQYMPLRGSSTASRPGMSQDEESKLSAERWLFEVPDAPWILASGRARHWPQARGVFLGSNKELAAWINDENHLRLMVRRWDCDLQAAVTLLYQAEEAVARALEQQRHRFARSDRLGYLTTCPSGLGSAFRAKLRASLPQLGQKEKFHDLVRALGVQAKRVVKSEGSWDLSAVPCGRITEESDDQVRTLVAAAHRLGQLEKSAEGLDLAAEVAKLC